MQLGRCPICHSRISLESCVQDEAGRELLAAVAQLDAALAVPLVTYLGLFRAPNRDLANDRALRLVREVMALGEPGPGYGPRLARALAETVEAIRAKGGVPLKSHNYLKRVLESAEQAPSPLIGDGADAGDQGRAPRGKASASSLAILNVKRLQFVE